MDTGVFVSFVDELEKISSRLHQQLASSAYHTARKAGVKAVAKAGKKSGKSFFDRGAYHTARMAGVKAEAKAGKKSGKSFFDRVASGIGAMGDEPIWKAPKKFSEAYRRG